MSLFKGKRQAKQLPPVPTEPDRTPGPTLPSTPPEPKTPIGTLLGTDDPEQQRQLIQSLLAPTVTVVLTYDAGRRQLDMATLGPRLSVAALQEILSRAQAELLNQAVNQAANQAAQQLQQAQQPAETRAGLEDNPE